MTDRELLELAAKAADMGRVSNGVLTGVTMYKTDDGWVEWDPLTDDGDALRLAVRLGLLLDTIRRGFKEGNVCAVHSTGAFYEPKQPDPYAATRRAIVRAAADIGAKLVTKPDSRPQNCGTGHCSCIECPYPKTDWSAA